MTAPARTGGTSKRNRATETTRRKATGNATEQTTETPVAPTRAATGGRTRSAAAERAYARRAQRTGQRVQVRTGAGRGESTRRKQRVEERPASRASFVVLVMVLLSVGVVATLWLSTQAIADSYRLDRAKKAATDLAERADSLQSEVATLGSAARIAEEAVKAGMVPSGDPGWIIVRPDGSTALVGDPKPAQPEPAPQSPAVQQQAVQQQAQAGQPPTAQQQPGQQQQSGQPQPGQQPGQQQGAPTQGGR